jgi:4-azaleucine resistance transporter AzlC
VSDAVLVGEGPATERVVLTGGGLLAGARRSLPIAVGIFTYGLVFGVLARQAGLSLGESALMSSLVYAGASQFTALGLWQWPVPSVAIVLTTFVVNLRHMMMSASLYPLLAKLRRPAVYGMLFFLTDESWALTAGEMAGGGRDVAFFLGAALTLFATWQSATVVGYVLGNAIPDPARWGLDFAFIAVFIVLLVGLWRGKRDLLPWVVAAVVAVVTSRLLPGNWYILFGGLSGSLVGAMRDAD